MNMKRPSVHAARTAAAFLFILRPPNSRGKWRESRNKEYFAPLNLPLVPRRTFLRRTTQQDPAYHRVDGCRNKGDHLSKRVSGLIKRRAFVQFFRLVCFFLGSLLQVRGTSLGPSCRESRARSESSLTINPRLDSPSLRQASRWRQGYLVRCSE